MKTNPRVVKFDLPFGFIYDRYKHNYFGRTGTRIDLRPIKVPEVGNFVIGEKGLHCGPMINKVGFVDRMMVSARSNRQTDSYKANLVQRREYNKYNTRPAIAEKAPLQQ